MELLIALVALLAIGLLVSTAFRAFVAVTIVHDYERGLRYRSGRLVGLANTGTHLTVRPLIIEDVPLPIGRAGSAYDAAFSARGQVDSWYLPGAVSWMPFIDTMVFGVARTMAGGAFCG